MASTMKFIKIVVSWNNMFIKGAQEQKRSGGSFVVALCGWPKNQFAIYRFWKFRWPIFLDKISFRYESYAFSFEGRIPHHFESCIHFLLLRCSFLFATYIAPFNPTVNILILYTHTHSKCFQLFCPCFLWYCEQEKGCHCLNRLMIKVL